MVPSVYEAILFQQRLHPHATAVVAGSAEVSYTRFCADIDKVTRILHSHAFPAGTRGAIAVTDAYLHWLALIALARLGHVSASAGIVPGELELLGAQVVLNDRGAPVEGRKSIAVGADWLGTLADTLPVFRDPHGHPADAPCRIILSSGTTGVQKKVLVTFAQLHHRLANVARAYGFNPAARTMSAVGFVTVAGFVSALNAWSSGRAFVLLVGQPGQTLPQLLQASRAGSVFLSPAQLAGMLDQLPDGYWAGQPFTIYTGGSTLPVSVNEKARMRLTQSLYVVYGSTETGTVTLGHAARADGRPGFSGFVVPSARVEIVSEKGLPLPAGTPGEVRVRATGMATGYLDDDGSISDGAFRDGWFHPGDIGVLGEDGALVIQGRIHDMMNMGGVKLSPTLLEQKLAVCPGVADIAAFSVPDAKGVDTPWVAVVAGEGFTDSRLLQLYATEFPVMPPLQVARIDRIPRNVMGKVLRNELRSLTQRALTGGAKKA
jgi:acyl-CoA synthetase (AMP-forming)/AMP-acid ligase II